MKNIIYRSLAASLIFLAMDANATLINRGNGLIYDTDLNITWLQNANSTRENPNSPNSTGRLTWESAQNWASNLSYAGYDDWRLPKTIENDPTCSWQISGVQRYGYACSNSEMGHLFYNEFSGIRNSFLNGADSDVRLFYGIQPGAYWSSTPDSRTISSPYGANQSWYFDFSRGFQSISGQTGDFFAWAVRDGDSVAPEQVPNNVPEPTTAFLTAIALFSVLAVGQRNRR